MHHKKELQELMRTYSSMKALQLLVALADCEGEISLAQLSAATGIPPSSTHRILQEMQHCGFVIKDEVKKCYRAGFEARLLAIQLQKTNFLYEAARGEMAYLNDLSLETIHLIGEEDMEMCIRDRVVTIPTPSFSLARMTFFRWAILAARFSRSSSMVLG